MLDDSHFSDIFREGGEVPFAKADILERYLAKFLDFLIAGAFFAFPSFVGPLAGITYILISDGLKGGRSLGKRIIGLKVIALASAAECDFRRSIIRNGIFGAALLIYFILGWIPYVGKIIGSIPLLAAVIIEAVLVYSDENGARFGDRIAGTMVVGRKG